MRRKAKKREFGLIYALCKVEIAFSPLTVFVTPHSTAEKAKKKAIRVSILLAAAGFSFTLCFDREIIDPSTSMSCARSEIKRRANNNHQRWGPFRSEEETKAK
jgi:hypothetical protein